MPAEAIEHFAVKLGYAVYYCNYCQMKPPNTLPSNLGIRCASCNKTWVYGMLVYYHCLMKPLNTLQSNVGFRCHVECLT